MLNVQAYIGYFGEVKNKRNVLSNFQSNGYSYGPVADALASHVGRSNDPPCNVCARRQTSYTFEEKKRCWYTPNSPRRWLQPSNSRHTRAMSKAIYRGKNTDITILAVDSYLKIVPLTLSVHVRQHRFFPQIEHKKSRMSRPLQHS